jgi:hypothetical protein
VHVLANGRIAREGGKELALELKKRRATTGWLLKILREDLSVKTGLEEVVAIDLFSAALTRATTRSFASISRATPAITTTDLTALNTAFLQSGVFLWIPKNVKLETPCR